MKTEVYRDPLSEHSTTFAVSVGDSEIRAALDPNVVLLQVRRTVVEAIASRIVAKLEPAIQAAIASIGEQLTDEFDEFQYENSIPATPVPTKYVLAETHGRYAGWLESMLREGSFPLRAIYLDGQPRKGDRIAPGCLVKLDRWYLNPRYTLEFRRSLQVFAGPEDWSMEDVEKGLTHEPA